MQALQAAGERLRTLEAAEAAAQERVRVLTEEFKTASDSASVSLEVRQLQLRGSVCNFQLYLPLLNDS